MFAIGVGHSINLEELHAIASQPSDEYTFEATTYEALNKLKNDLAWEVCQGM